ncbi:MAG: ester cyclase [Pseudomonadota bacterium]
MADAQANKQQMLRFYAALDQAAPADTADVLREFTADSYRFRGVHPFNELEGADEVAAKAWEPLWRALGPMQRRTDIFMAGANVVGDGGDWVCAMGHLVGLFDAPWLGIPSTGKLLYVRFADFNRLEQGKIVETGFFFDLIGVMRQAGLEPLPPQTGVDILVPGPQTHDGLLLEPQSDAEGEQTLALVTQMKDDLQESYGTRVSPELLQRTWHDDMTWYGPSGIGSTHTIPRYQEQHQYPFRESLDNIVLNGHVCRFAEGRYACWFGWPNLTMTPTGGFLGLPACDKRVDMRVVDIYRREGDKLAENWVLIDLPYWLLQQGVDVLDRTLRHS